MASDHTRGAILAAAERLYADRGFGDVTLRDIVAAADVNLAAVNYHFGSKDELIAELFVTRSLALNRQRLRELKAADAPVASHALGAREAYFRLIAGHRVGERQGEADSQKTGTVLSHRRRFAHGFAPAGAAA